MPVRRRPRDRQRRPRPDRRAGDGADADPLPRALRVAAAAGRRPRRLAGAVPALRGGGVAALLLGARLLGAGARRAPRPPTSAAPPPGWSRSRTPTAASAPRPATTRAPEMTGWAMLGLEAAGRNPLDVARGGHTPVDFLRGHVDELSSPGDLARTILALEGAGVDPREFGGRNLVSALLDQRAATTAPTKAGPDSTAFAVIALRAAGATGGLDKSLAWLREVQNDDGGWGDVPGSPSTADGTGAVMQALSPDSKAAKRGLAYLRKAQRPGGGFPLGGNGAVNTQSTAWAIQGILAAGGDPASFRRGGDSAPRLPRRPPGKRRPLPLLEVQRPDPDLGHRPGPGRRRRRPLPDRRAAAREPKPQLAPTEHRRHRRRSTPAAAGPPAPTGPRSARRANPRAAAAGPLRQRSAPSGRTGSGGAGRAADLRGAESRRRRRGGAASEESRTGRQREPAAPAPPKRAEQHRRRRSSSACSAGGRLFAAASAPAASGCAGATALRTRAAARQPDTLDRWTSRRRSAPAAPTRPSGRSRCRASSSRSCSSWPAGRRTTTSPCPGASASSGPARWRG